MKKIGILYICTGPYAAFWEDFYKTSEQFFLSGFERHYFVFSDQRVEDFGAGDRVHNIHIDNLPWPLITLLRYHFFLSVADELGKMDYLMFSNANMIFVDYVTREEILPREENDEDIFVVTHPGYCNRRSCQAPFERSRKNAAYVPYNYRGKYVIGAVNGGTCEAFLRMSEAIVQNVNEDLKKNRIASWHDESQLNHYIAGYRRYRLLTPEYCYPYGFDLPIEKKIIAVSKQEKFDVKSFKGMKTEKRDLISRVRKRAGSKGRAFLNSVLCIRENMLFR